MPEGEVCQLLPARQLAPARSLRVADGLLAAAQGYGYRMPELRSGSGEPDACPDAIPAACRPEAWSAVAAVACAQASCARARG